MRNIINKLTLTLLILACISSVAMLYASSHYPECDAYVRVHTGTNIPVGTMAARKLRQLRNEAHKHFSKLIRDDYMTKQEAYQ